MKISHLNTNVFISYDKYITLDERLKLRFHVENDDSPPCSCQLCWVIDQALLVGDHLSQILLSLYWPVLLSLTHRVELLTRPHQTVGDFTFLVDDTLSADDASLYITPVTQFNNCVMVRSRRLDWDWIHITLLTVECISYCYWSRDMRYPWFIIVPWTLILLLYLFCISDTVYIVYTYIFTSTYQSTNTDKLVYIFCKFVQNIK